MISILFRVEAGVLTVVVFCHALSILTICFSLWTLAAPHIPQAVSQLRAFGSNCSLCLEQSSFRHIHVAPSLTSFHLCWSSSSSMAWPLYANETPLIPPWVPSLLYFLPCSHHILHAMYFTSQFVFCLSAFFNENGSSLWVWDFVLFSPVSRANVLIPDEHLLNNGVKVKSTWLHSSRYSAMCHCSNLHNMPNPGYSTWQEFNESSLPLPFSICTKNLVIICCLDYAWRMSSGCLITIIR
jgi:hypothetical protein